MKKVLIIVIVLAVLGGSLFVGYQHFMPASGNQNQTGGPPEGTMLCDVAAHTCSAIEKTADSGVLKVILTTSGKAVEGLEVDVASQPGANKYYTKSTDASGGAVFDGIPAGNYFIYFNTENFPTQYGTPPTAAVSVFGGKTVEKSVDFIKI